MSAAKATLEVMVSLDVPSLARHAGASLSLGLRGLKGVASVRGRGLLLGAVLEDGLDADAIVKAALHAGLVINAPVAGVLRIAPPLIVSDAEIKEALAILRGVLDGRCNT
jgi:acetylornithine/succinyldiaminopimelate/putrescine aminotransferase